nr:uncharacterized protein LOC129397940 [Pan paniscus]
MKEGALGYWEEGCSRITLCRRVAPPGKAPRLRQEWGWEISSSALRISLCTSSPGSWWALVATGVFGAASLWLCWGWIRASRSPPAGTTGATGGSPRTHVALFMQEESESFPSNFPGMQQNTTQGAAVFSDS